MHALDRNRPAQPDSALASLGICEERGWTVQATTLTCWLASRPAKGHFDRDVDVCVVGGGMQKAVYWSIIWCNDMQGVVESSNFIFGASKSPIIRP